MSTLVRPQTAYGISQPTFNVAAAPIISTRAPVATDYSPLGTLWVNTATNVSWILTSVVANVATWSQTTP